MKWSILSAFTIASSLVAVTLAYLTHWAVGVAYILIALVSGIAVFWREVGWQDTLSSVQEATKDLFDDAQGLTQEALNEIASELGPILKDLRDGQTEVIDRLDRIEERLQVDPFYEEFEKAKRRIS